MRTLGPGSVSSFLKVVLDIFYVVIWIGVILAAAIALIALLISFNPEALSGTIQITDVNFVRFVEASGSLVAFLVIVGRLRRIFATLIAGDPFHPDNVRRLRVIGLALAALEFGRYLVRAAAAVLWPAAGQDSMSVSLTAWFSVLVVFVLAEVFREGARLRGEAELTI